MLVIQQNNCYLLLQQFSSSYLLLALLQMQVFRKKFLYNTEKPLYASEKVRSYNCMNTETKDSRFLLLHHLEEAPFVEPSPSILQPIEAPTLAEPYSVYPMVNCCSEIGKVSESDAMYVLKCLLESKQKNPLYYLLAPQGICTSQIEGLLPEKSPSLFSIVLDLLDLPESLKVVEKSVVSQQGYQICRAIKQGENPSSMLNRYGWKDVKKGNVVKDNNFWIFKGRKKQQGPFSEEYGLAWHPEYGLCRFKYIDLGKDGYQEQFYEEFKNKIQSYGEAHSAKIDVLKIHKFEKDSKGIKIFTEIPNQGPLSEYIIVKNAQGKTLNEENSLGLLEAFVSNMRKIKEQSSLRAFGILHLKNLFVHNNRLTIGEPILVTDKVEKKLRELKNSVDYFSPELKQNILLPQSLFKLSFQKMDIWFFGFMLHKMLAREVPVFDPTRKPVLSKGTFTPGMLDLINRCLSLTPGNRPDWNDINLKELSKRTFVQEIQQEVDSPAKEEIKLGTRKERIVSSRDSLVRSNKISNEHLDSPEKLKRSEFVEEEPVKFHQEEEKEPVAVIQVVSSPKFKKFKTILRIFLVMCLYVFVFFRPFLGNSIDLLLVRGYYNTASLHLTNNAGDRSSTATILTNNANYFLLNDISFEKIYSELNCIDNRFNPIHDPNYELNSFIQSGSFLALLLTGWLVAIVICVVKGISMWKGGVGNQSHKNVEKYWSTYTFFELCLACLLFVHFYIYQFFYFSLAEPCFGIQNFSGIEPFFDSSLYIFLGNEDEYMEKVFASMGILSMVLLVSTLIYAWGPKADSKNFFSLLSLLFRVLPYILLVLICRVGLFMVLAPTALNDENQILESLISSSFVGILGIIPEIFILVVVIFEFLLEMAMIKLQEKIMESNKWSRFFGLKKGRGTENRSKLSKIEESKLNDMSMLDVSKHKLMVEDY